MQEDAESLKAKILAQDKEITVEKFEALIQEENNFTEKELEDFYKEFKNFLHGGKFASYAEIIFKHYPAVDKIRSQVARKEQNSKAPLTKFFGAADADKRPRESVKKAGEGQSSKKKTDIKDYFQRKPT